MKYKTNCKIWKKCVSWCSFKPEAQAGFFKSRGHKMWKCWRGNKLPRYCWYTSYKLVTCRTFSFWSFASCMKMWKCAQSLPKYLGGDWLRHWHASPQEGIISCSEKNKSTKPFLFLMFGEEKREKRKGGKEKTFVFLTHSAFGDLGA